MYETEVTRGWHLLDSTVPDWRQRIDPDRLQMLMKDRCVIGQVGNGSWAEGLRMAGLFDFTLADRLTLIDHGFWLRDGGWGNYSELRKTWANALRAGQPPLTSSPVKELASVN